MANTLWMSLINIITNMDTLRHKHENLGNIVMKKYIIIKNKYLTLYPKTLSLFEYVENNLDLVIPMRKLILNFVFLI